MIPTPKKLGEAPFAPENEAKKCQFQVPILALHGLEDQVLPPDCSKTLVQRAADGVKSVRLQLLEKDTHRMESALPHVLDFIFHHAPREKGRAELKRMAYCAGRNGIFTVLFLGGMVLGVNQKAQEWVVGIHHLGFGIHHFSKKKHERTFLMRAFMVEDAWFHDHGYPWMIEKDDYEMIGRSGHSHKNRVETWW